MSLVTSAPRRALSASQETATGRARELGWVDRFGLAVILVGFCALGLWYSLAIPAFETPDEVYHYAFARHLAQGHGLPVQSETATGPWQQEGSQAPLYYWLVGRLTAGIDQSDFEQVAVFNPRSNMGNPLYPGNKNRMLYSAAPRPLSGTNLALHVARWLSLALGGLTIWCVARTARLAFAPGDRRSLLPPLLVAVIPQFVFISASCSNDALVIAASAAVLYWLARLLARPAPSPIAAWEWAGLGLLLGLAALSKLQGLGLWALAAGVGLALAWKRRDGWLPWRALLLVGLPAVMVAGWWYWRNWTLYGDWTGAGHLMSINGRRTEPLEWDEFWLEFRGLRYSAWGLFGWFNLLLPQWVYTLLDGLSVAALAGLIPALWLGWFPRLQSLGTGKPLSFRAAARNLAAPRHPAERFLGQSLGMTEAGRSIQRVRLLLVAWALLSAALVFYWMNVATGSQGRLFFPALGAVAVLAVVGLEFWAAWLPAAAAWGLRSAGLGLLLGCTLYAGAVLFPASYGAPQPVAALPARAQPVDLRFGDAEVIELLAVEPPTGRYYPGDQVPLTLYLRAPARLTQDYELFIQLLDERGEVVGNVTTHPGWGRAPTRLWTPGAIYADPYTVQVRKPIDRRSPLLARVYTGFVDPADPDLKPLAARTAAGAEVMPVVATVVLQPFSPPQPAELGLTAAAVQFDAGIRLAGVAGPAAVQAGRPLTVTLLWEATAPPGQDYTAFVHLLGPDGQPVTGFDRGPGGDRYPTRVWAVGDRVVSEFGLTVPAATAPGLYTLWAGLYAAGSGGAERLPVQEAGGLPMADARVQVGEVRIMP